VAVPVVEAVLAEAVAVAPAPTPDVAVVASAPVVAEAPQPVAAPEIAPIPDPIIVPQAPPPAPVDLDASLHQAGLVLIETNSATPRPVVAEEAPKLGRKPRAAQVVAAEPLQMVETRRD
jgi:hypothetical protein